MGKRILTLDIGASRVALAEYEQNGAELTLTNYGTSPLAAPVDTGDAETILAPAIMDIVKEKGIKPGDVSITVSGQMVFPRFAAIPEAGGQDKFEQMVRYEVEQNIPFPIDEMVCDRQVLGDTPDGDKSVMIVAAKLEQIDGITSALVSCGFNPTIVGVSPIAVVNAIRYVNGDDGSCKVILDIGAKTTSLIIAEGEKLFIRSIPIGGNNLNRDIASALGISQADAENLKRTKGYVSAGGVTEDEDPEADAISKVARTVLTRLHAEISRSVNFSRSQQGFSAPPALYLTGGTALLGQVDTFFAESLGIEVVFFNPFDRIQVGGGVDADQLGSDAALLGAATGAAVQAISQASLNINLIPPAILEAKAEKAKIPLVAAGGAMLVAGLVAVLVGVSGVNSKLSETYETLDGKKTSLNSVANKVKQGEKQVETAVEDATKTATLLFARERTMVDLGLVSSVLADGGMWIDKWESGKTDEPVKITIRGWKDKLDEMIKADGKGRTAAEIVVDRIVNSQLKSNQYCLVHPEDIKILENKEIGKDGNVRQFVMEVKFQ